MGGVQHAWPPDHDDSGSGASCGMRHSALTNVFTLQDVDLYVRQCRPMSLVVIMFCGVVAAIALTFLPPLVHDGKLVQYACGIMLIPLVYFGFRWRQIVEMQKGFPLLTEILALILAVKLAAMAAGFFVGAFVNHAYQREHFGNPAAVVVYFIGAACTLFAHRWSKRRGESPTLRFYTAAFVYLFMTGTGYLATVLYARYVNQFSYGFAAWCIGPIHMVSSRLPSSVISCSNSDFN
jgi:hypothetical protein